MSAESIPTAELMTKTYSVSRLVDAIKAGLNRWLRESPPTVELDRDVRSSPPTSIPNSSICVGLPTVALPEVDGGVGRVPSSRDALCPHAHPLRLRSRRLRRRLDPGREWRRRHDGQLHELHSGHHELDVD